MSDMSSDIRDIEALMKQAQAGTNKYVCPTLEDSVSCTKERIDDVATKSATVHDHYGNSLASIGTDDKVESFTSYGFSNDTLNWTLWLALYNDSWVFRRAIDKPSQDEVSCGFTLHGESDFTKVYKLYDRYKTDMIQLLQWGALFGGSVAVMLFEDISEDEMKEPINKQKIRGKRMRLYVTDRWYGGYADNTDTVSNMRDMDYGKPKYYRICFPDGKEFIVHHSYVLRYEHRQAPPLIKYGQLQGWGYAEGAHILNELSRDDQIKSAVASLINKSLIEVIKMSGMRGVFMGTDKGNEDQLRKRLEMVNWGRTYNSLTFLDKDDEYDQHQMTSLAGLADLMDKNMWLIGAALEMQGILYGDLKGGLSQESDAMKRYSVTIRNRCNSYFRPVLTKLLTVIYLICGIEESVDFEFNSLVESDDNKEKVESIKALSEMLSQLEQNGVISKYQYAKTLSEYMNNGSINITIDESYLNMLKLQEEQDIIDTIVDLSGKGRQLNKPNLGSSTIFGEEAIPTTEPEVPLVETTEQEGELAHNEEQLLQK